MVLRPIFIYKFNPQIILP